MDQEDMQPPMMAGGSNLHAEAGALQYQLDNIQLADTLMHNLKGEVKRVNRETGQVVWFKQKTAWLNQDGIDLVQGYIDTYIYGTKTFALSEFDEEYIQAETISVGKELIRALRDNWNKYAVKDLASASFIVQRTTGIIYSILMKSKNARYLDFLRSTLQDVQSRSSHQVGQPRPQEDSSNGIMNFLFNKKRR